MRPPGAEKDWGIMKNSGMSETMQTLMRKSVCALLSLLLLLSAVLPVKAAAETAPVKVVRIGSFEKPSTIATRRAQERATATNYCRPYPAIQAGSSNM